MRPLLALAVTLGIAGCDQAPAPQIPPPPPAPAAEQAPAGVMGNIVGVNVAWGDFYSRGDAAGIASLYTEDAVLMDPAGDARGRPAIQRHFARLFRERPDSILRINTASETVDVAGNRAYEAGTILLTIAPRSGGPSRDRAVRYMTFWQQDGLGQWQMRYSLRPAPSGP